MRRLVFGYRNPTFPFRRARPNRIKWCLVGGQDAAL
jgi:hypothetical protein